MVKKILVSTLVSAALTSAAVAAEDNTNVGVGVGITNGSSVLLLPIDVSKQLRIEPEFGLSYRSQNNNDQTGFLIGTGVFMMQQPSAKINMYFGGKALINYASYDYGAGNTSDTQLVLGGTFGFEYKFEQHFSLGGEANLYLGVGDYTTLNTEGMGILRYYF